MTVTIIVPAHNAAAHIEACCASVEAALDYHGSPESTCVVVDDGSTDNSAGLAREHGVAVMAAGWRRGASHARNLAARHARTDVLFFVDADCCLHVDAVSRVLRAFDEDPALDAIVGSYDDRPSDPHPVSQFRNLLHCYTHRVARPEASTFWTGCGAVRREAFFRAGGFDESWHYMEDIEFGMRLKKIGGRIRFDPAIQVQHRKCWTFAGTLRTDIFGRAVPWTLLLLRARVLPNDLNLRMSQRISAFAAATLAFALGASPWSTASRWLALACLAAILILNRDFYRFLANARSPAFAAMAVPLHILYFLCAVAGACIAILRAVRSRF